VGRATARAFARRGAKLGLLARPSDGLDATRAEVKTAIAIPTDVADADAVKRAASRVEDELGPIDIWVNNAMATVFSPVAEITPDEFRRATEVTSRWPRCGACGPEIGGRSFRSVLRSPTEASRCRRRTAGRKRRSGASRTHFAASSCTSEATST
jgi:NAD(P)-dependent dehydrogenase (short-subunit alcohol dehydrogenase family)